jgi:hypothetical protein
MEAIPPAGPEIIILTVPMALQAEENYVWPALSLPAEGRCLCLHATTAHHQWQVGHPLPSLFAQTEYAVSGTGITHTLPMSNSPLASARLVPHEPMGYNCVMRRVKLRS